MQGEILQEEPKEKTAEKKDAFAKYTAKDSVFSTLFQDKKYLIQLYRALHPEDTETTEDALMDITIRNVLTNGFIMIWLSGLGIKSCFWSSINLHGR